MSRLSTAATTLGLAIVLVGSSLAQTSYAAAGKARQLTGNQLVSALPTSSAFPAGYKRETGADFSSGRSLEHGAAKYHLATMSCATFYFATVGFGETAAAGNGFGTLGKVNHGDLQEAYQFASANAAAAFYRGSFAVFHRCRTTSIHISSSLTLTITTRSMTTTHIAGMPAFWVDQVNTDKQAVEHMDFLYILAGNDVLIVAPFGSPGVATKPTAASIGLGVLAHIRKLGG